MKRRRRRRRRRRRYSVEFHLCFFSISPPPPPAKIPVTATHTHTQTHTHTNKSHITKHLKVCTSCRPCKYYGMFCWYTNMLRGVSIWVGHTNLLHAVLQDLKGLGQVPRLSPSPRREQRAARGQRQRQQGQRSPDDPQLAHSPPLQNPMHVGADCAATRRRRPSEMPTPTSFRQSMKSLQMRFCPNGHFGEKDAARARACVCVCVCVGCLQTFALILGFIWQMSFVF